MCISDHILDAKWSKSIVLLLIFKEDFQKEKRKKIFLSGIQSRKKTEAIGDTEK